MRKVFNFRKRICVEWLLRMKHQIRFCRKAKIDENETQCSSERKASQGQWWFKTEKDRNTRHSMEPENLQQNGKAYYLWTVGTSHTESMVLARQQMWARQKTFSESFFCCSQACYGRETGNGRCAGKPCVPG